MTDQPVSTPRTVVLIHGLWLSSLSWEHWITRYADRGVTAIAPEWPRMDPPRWTSTTTPGRRCAASVKGPASRDTRAWRAQPVRAG
jgi:hypothetical protein